MYWFGKFDVSSSSFPIPWLTDLRTVVLHEAGHSLGLPDSNVSTEVMYAYIAPGEWRRVITAGDWALFYVIY